VRLRARSLRRKLRSEVGVLDPGNDSTGGEAEQAITVPRDSSRGGSFGLGEPVADGKGEAGKNVTAVEILILELRSATHELWDGRVILGSERGCDIEGNLPPGSGPMGATGEQSPGAARAMPHGLARLHTSGDRQTGQNCQEGQ
jgi:hypothetical protein